MARTIVEQFWCDWHDLLREQDDGHTDRVTASVKVTISVDNGDPVDIDLDAVCNEELIDPIRQLVARARPSENLSRPPRGRGGPQGTLPAIFGCKLCDVTPYTNKNSLVTHIWREHVQRDRPPQPDRCPDCARTYAPAGMSLHRSIHGWDPVLEAYDNVPKRRGRG